MNQMSGKATRGHQLPWGLSQLWPVSHVSWEPNSGLLKEQRMLLIWEPSLKPQAFYFLKVYFILYVWELAACIYMHLYARRSLIPWKLSYGWLWATMWVVGTWTQILCKSNKNSKKTSHLPSTKNFLFKDGLTMCSPRWSLTSVLLLPFSQMLEPSLWFVVLVTWLENYNNPEAQIQIPTFYRQERQKHMV